MATSVCPRCRSNATAVRAQSPAAGVWIIFGCDTCFYTWRSTEPAANTDPDQYPQVFRKRCNLSCDESFVTRHQLPQRLFARQLRLRQRRNSAACVTLAPCASACLALSSRIAWRY